MSFVFRGTREDIETGFPGFVPERRAMVAILLYLGNSFRIAHQKLERSVFFLFLYGESIVILTILNVFFQKRFHAGTRPVNTNSMVLLVTVLLLFMILNSHQMSPNFLIWLVLGVFLMATTLRMYATCQQLHAQAQAHAAAASGLLGHTELRFLVPPSMAFAARGRLQGLRLQLALLDRELDDLDYDTLRALDADNNADIPSMTEEEINALPVHKYKVQTSNGFPGSQNDGSLTQLASTSSASTTEKKQVHMKVDTHMRSPDDELTCSVCLEQVNVGEVIRTLPCLHQFHASCIDPWLRQQGTCPICKYRVGSAWQSNHEGVVDAAYMV